MNCSAPDVSFYLIGYQVLMKYLVAQAMLFNGNVYVICSRNCAKRSNWPFRSILNNLSWLQFVLFEFVEEICIS
jgi:hypothetical protein